ncbi:MAG: CoB--CoM heterodisulfide reductase iron-sulfur subunit B family protein [Thermodesulfobacteriota bacterium]
MRSETTYAYYPGCSQLGTATDYDKSTRACCAKLDIHLQDIPDWSCCGSTPAHTVDHTLSGALSLRNLQLAEQLNPTCITTPCPSCLTNLKGAAQKAEDPQSREAMNALLDTPYTGSLDVKSTLQILVEDFGVDALAAKVSKPLTGLVVAPYYGCIMNRPPEAMQFDDPENPTAMDRILEACGATVAPYPLKVECCGASYGIPRKDIVAHLSHKLLSLAEDVGAMAMVTACPLCQMNLDLRQKQINKLQNADHNMPVFYFTQLLGLALGLPSAELGLEKLAVNPKDVLNKAKARAIAEAAS